MPEQTRKILVTSALPYANGSIHLGHLLEHIQTDIWTRFQRMRGHSCYSVCADDAHGTPVMLKAQQLGITPEQMVVQTRDEHHQDLIDFGVDYDNYHVTHSDENKELCELVYNRLDDAGFIRKCFCQIVLYKVLVQSVLQKIRMATAVTYAVPHTTQLN